MHVLTADMTDVADVAEESDESAEDEALAMQNECRQLTMNMSAPRQRPMWHSGALLWMIAA